ncbi:hypothetical protein DFO58_1370 [Arthrobacter sp. AG1021]|uniref:hypothetical protein n=1 Tax=Arthrobacter sp. AG1021 TaxID=2183908 RepID=UPI000EB199A7|nr:hypothetical protein [Arthrobacter sp. AG1021]RKS20824.1 hypothetical protein DFO58_1370 [Arthrobacter sp. AG1021]
MQFAELWSKSQACLALMAMLILTELLALLVPVETEHTSREGLSVASSFGILFCGVVLGTYAAWVGGRFGIAALRRVRGPHRIAATALQLLAPPLVVGASAYLLGYATVMYRMGEVFVPDPGLFLLSMLMMLGLCLGGLGLGLLFAPKLAIGLSIVLFSGLQLLSLVAPGPMLSNMAGLSGCCTRDSAPNPIVIQAVALCYLGWSMLGVLAICVKAQNMNRMARRALAVAGALSLTVLWGGGALAAQDAGEEQQLSRTSELRCEEPGDGHEYCFWPGEAEHWNDWRSNITAGVGQLEQATGIQQPRIITSSKAHAEATGGLLLDFEDRYSPETVKWDLAMKMSVNPTEQCLGSLAASHGIVGTSSADTEAQQHMWAQTNLLHQWWTTKADRDFFDSAESAQLDALNALNEQSQISWVKRAAAGVENCQLVLLPGS